MDFSSTNCCDCGPLQPYYAFTDNLGSYTRIYDNSGNEVYHAEYDPWGKQTVMTNTIHFFRGYTGHEMLMGWNIINMNGRLYDPVLGRFLSPDNYVQLPDYSQSYNRYTYCLNNPLKYTDPSGEFWHLIIGAAIGGVFNWMSNGCQFNAKGLGYFTTGAVAGAVGAGVAAGVNVAMAGGSFWSGAMGLAQGVASTGFLAGAATGACAGFAGGFISGAGNSWLGGSNFGNGLLDGLKSGGINALIGGITGGIHGGLDALHKGTNFWTGTAKFDLNGAYTCSGCMLPDFEINESTITGKYVGKFEDVNVFETDWLGSAIVYDEHGFRHYRAITIPERGIIAGEGVFSSIKYGDRAMIQHEFGHILQYRKVGAYAYWHVIAPESITSASVGYFDSYESHHKFWTETWANYLSKGYFGRAWIGGAEYPAINISRFNRWRIIAAQLQSLMMFKPRGFI